MNFSWLLLISAACLLKKNWAKIIFDQQASHVDWKFLTKFYFHPIHGHLDISSNPVNATVKFFALNEQEWRQVKDDLASICGRNELVLQPAVNRTDLWILSSSFTLPGHMYFVSKICNASSIAADFLVTYRFSLTNGDNLFTEHFSNDERGSLELFIVSTIVCTIILLVALQYIYSLKTKSSLIIKLFLLAILCSWLSSLIAFTHTLIFALTGNMDANILRLLLFLARFCALVAQILFLLVLMLYAKGYWIIEVQLKKRSIVKILGIVLVYSTAQIVMLIITTIFVDQVLVNERVFVICSAIQVVLAILTGLWFILSLLFTMKRSRKKFYFFSIFSIWFAINALVALLSIFDVVTNPQITILRAIEITNQYVAYSIFLLALRNKTYFLQTRLNQINVIYIDPTMSKPCREPVLPKENDSRELTNLCTVGETWASRYRWMMRSSGPLPRLVPRRDISIHSTTQPSVVLSHPTIGLASGQLAPTK